MGDSKPMSSGTGTIKKRKGDKVRKRDQRSWENVIKSVGNLSEGEKITVIQEKYNDLYSDVLKLSATVKVLEKHVIELQKDKDTIKIEMAKHIMTKAKLESLCRELQKQNKAVKDESITRMKEEEERRRQVAASFTEKLNALTALMDENKDKSEREGHLESMNRQLELQKTLSNTQIEKLKVEFDSERQLWERERLVLLNNLEKSDQANAILQENIKSLQEHLDSYKVQYIDFESTMEQSSKMFDTFKDEMAKVQKMNEMLEKQRNDFRDRWQSCTSSVLQLSDLHQQTSSELKVAEKKVTTLEKLCRQLQVERTAYLQQLEENNIEPRSAPRDDGGAGEGGEVAGPSGVQAPPPPAPVPAQRRLTSKENLFVALRTELKVMEDDIKKKITTKQKELAALKSDLKLVMEQRKIANQQGALRREEAAKEDAATLALIEEAASMEGIDISSISLDDDQDSILTADSTLTADSILAAESILGADSLLAAQSSVTTESALATESTVTTESSVYDENASSLEDKPVKKAQSCPLTTEEVKQTDSSSSTSTSIDDILLAELSLGTIPLYKPEGVTDLTVQPEGGPLVTEAEARTNLLEEPVTSSILETSSTEETEDTEAVPSSETIPLKETEAKTEINKED